MSKQYSQAPAADSEAISMRTFKSGLIIYPVAFRIYCSFQLNQEVIQIGAIEHWLAIDTDNNRHLRGQLREHKRTDARCDRGPSYLLQQERFIDTPFSRESSINLDRAILLPLANSQTLYIDKKGSLRELDHLFNISRALRHNMSVFSIHREDSNYDTKLAVRVGKKELRLNLPKIPSIDPRELYLHLAHLSLNAN
jgi:hypothetical protein